MSAETWTDANGTIWNFSTSGENATIVQGISGTISTNLVIPTMVYVNDTPYTVTSIGNDAFGSSQNIRSLYITDLKKYLQISSGNDYSHPLSHSLNNVDLYLNNTLVTTLEIPEGVTQIPDHAFRNCTNLTSVTFPEGVTSIGRSAFAGCSSLTSINLPDDVTSIGNWAFGGCSNLTSINIPEGVTSIEGYAFCGCLSLTSITIPEGVTSIGDNAFSSIGGYIYCESTTPSTIGGSAIDNQNIILFQIMQLKPIVLHGQVTAISL